MIIVVVGMRITKFSFASEALRAGSILCEVDAICVMCHAA